LPWIARAYEVWSQCRVKYLRQWSAGKIRGLAVRVEGTDVGKPRGARLMDRQVAGRVK